MRTQELATGATTTALTFVLLGLAGCSTEDGGDHPAEHVGRIGSDDALYYRSGR